MVYLKKYKLAYVYDDQTETTLKYCLKTQTFTAVMKGSLSLNQGKLLRKSENEELLYIRTGKGELTVICSLMNSTNYGQIELFSSKTNIMVDFRSVGNEKILAVSDLGEISLAKKVEKSDYEFVVVERYNLELREDEVVTCLNVSNCSKYFSIGTKWGRNQLCKLYFLRIHDGETKNINEKFIVDFKNEDYALQPESYFYEINMDLDIEGDMVLMCYQRYGGNFLVPLIFKNRFLELLSDPFVIHSGLFGKASVFKDNSSEVWSIDAAGSIKRAKII